VNPRRMGRESWRSRMVNIPGVCPLHVRAGSSDLRSCSPTRGETNRTEGPRTTTRSRKPLQRRGRQRSLAGKTRCIRRNGWHVLPQFNMVLPARGSATGGRTANIRPRRLTKRSYCPSPSRCRATTSSTNPTMLAPAHWARPSPNICVRNPSERGKPHSLAQTLAAPRTRRSSCRPSVPSMCAKKW